MPNVPLLIPGLGAQGGTAKDVAAGFDENGLGAVINSSRAIIFAHSRKEFSAQSSWQKSVEAATRATIQQLASETSAGKLGANLTA
jgi:orotidine-5'-phosphate decarboxylase